MKYGAAVNVYDEVHFISLSDPQHKRNLLQQATLKDNLPVLDFLYTYTNINVNLLDSVSLLLSSHSQLGNTCIHLAAEQGFRRCLTYLIYHGAMINCRNKAGLLPDLLATNAGHPEIADFLHGITAPPEPPCKIATFKTKRKGEAEIHWALPAQPNYFPPIDAVEVQIKQNKFFDSWRTVETLKSSTRGPEPEDEAKQRIEAIRFDRKCGNVEPMEKKVEELAQSDPAVFVKRALPEKNWVSPSCECVVELPVAQQQYVVRLRCGNKYGFGAFSNAVNVELNGFAPKKKGEKEKEKEKGEI